MNTEYIYSEFLKTQTVTTDSRKCTKGSIYFALKGDRFNGNNFAKQAIENGCSMAVIDDENLRDSPKCVFVTDVLSTLQQVAALHIKKSAVTVIGITGSNGKTTTKELLAAVLSKKFNVWFTQGNLNNHIGVPLTILSMPANTELAVIEMGANHVGEIAELCKISQPSCGLITNVGKAHLEGFGSFDGVKRGKSELYSYIKNKNGEVFINGDNNHLLEMLGSEYQNRITYGLQSTNLTIAENAKSSPYLTFNWQHNSGTWHNASLQLSGLYNLENALAAIAVGKHFKIEEDQINDALAKYSPQNNRSQITETKNNNTLILDAYNANPSSMNVALENFQRLTNNNKVAILGAMKELGADSEYEHKLLIEKITNSDISQCFLVGSEFSALIPNSGKIKHFEDVTLLYNFLANHPITNSLILIKGSRSNELEKTISLL